MSLTNIHRDCFHLELKSAEVSLSSDFLFTAPPTVNSTGIVNDGPVASETSDRDVAVTVAANSYKAMGVLMKPPLVDRTPYRVKARGHGGLVNMLLVGYAPASPTGSNDTLDRWNYQSFGFEYDDIIMLPALESTDAMYGRPIFFGVAVPFVSASHIQVDVSVQKLSIAPPQFEMGVS